MIRYFLLLIILLLTGCQTGFYRGPVSDHFDGKKFYYPGEKNNKRSFLFDVISLFGAVLKNRWPKQLPDIHYSTLPSYPDGVKVTFVNHSTVLIQTKKTNILMDPVWSYRVSPFPFLGPARVREPGIKFIDLPKIDVVLISHNHYDHLDIATLERLNEVFHPLFIVPLGNKIFLQYYKINNVIELDWWQKHKIKNTIITFLPAHHSTTRWLYDLNWTLWGSYGIEVDNKKIYFAGDTSYTHHFKMIRSRWGAPHFSFLPIGAYEPRELLKEDHLNPQDAVNAHQDLNSDFSTGIHWGTFQLSSESLDQPIKDLTLARIKSNVSEKKFFILREGYPIFLQSLKNISST